MPCYYPFRKEEGSPPLPCGKCPYCIIRRSNSWAFRLRQELKVADSATFVTFTYDQPPISLEKGFPTLFKRDVQNFFKRLRKIPRDFTEKPIRYLLVGEYGTNTFRPHYHAVILNAENSSIDEAWIGFKSAPQNRSRKYAKSRSHWQYKNYKWQKRKDFHKVSLDTDIVLGHTFHGDVNEKTIQYVVKYLHKVKKVPLFHDDDRLPEFQLQSRFLGASFLTQEVINYYRLNPSKNFVTMEGFKSALPRYYRDKIFDDEMKFIALQVAVSQANIKLEEQFQAWLNYKGVKTFEEWRYEQKKASVEFFVKSAKKRL